MKTNKKIWAGRIITILATLFLAFDAIIKILKLKVVTDSFVQLGYNPNISVGLGLILLISVILYAIPRTSILGAILLTGYLGGAVATNLRAGTPLFSNVLFPVYFGILVWLALYLRFSQLRDLVPCKK